MREADLGWQAFASLFAISVLYGIGVLFVFRRWSDQTAILRSTNLIIAHLLEFRLFLDEPGLILRAQGDLIRENLRLMRLLLRTALIVTAPMLVVFEPLDAIYRHVPLAIGEPAIVTMQMKKTGNAALHAPDGVQVETPPVQVLSEHQVSWRIRPVRPATGEVQIAWQGRTLTRSVLAGTGGLHYVAVRTRLFMDQDVDWIEISYPLATVLGWHWLMWFSLISTAAVVVGRKMGA